MPFQPYSGSMTSTSLVSLVRADGAEVTRPRFAYCKNQSQAFNVQSVAVVLVLAVISGVVLTSPVR